MANQEKKAESPKVESPKVEKPPKPMAPLSGKLPDLPAECEWDTLTIGKFQYRLPVAKSPEGAAVLCKGNGEILVQLFTRGQRIAIPEKLGARKPENAPKSAQEAEKLQKAILDFDLSTINIRQPKAPVVLDKAEYSNAEVAAILAAIGRKVVSK